MYNIVIVVVIGVVLFVVNAITPPTMDGEPIFEGDSRELQATKVVPTLDAPILSQKQRPITCPFQLTTFLIASSFCI